MKVLRPIVLIGCMVGVGCADTKAPSTQPTSVRDRQDAALRDPFGYTPEDAPNISGGKINEFDKKGFDHDVDRVLNP